MLESPSEHGRRQWVIADDLARRWMGSIGLAAAVGLAYFLAAQLSLGVLLEPDGVAVFWPAAGISSGGLVALGPPARWRVAAGAHDAAFPADLTGALDVSAGEC